jgi:hypothetical protein
LPSAAAGVVAQDVAPDLLVEAGAGLLAQVAQLQQFLASTAGVPKLP